MGEVGVRKAGGERRVMETDRCGHGYVRPRNTGNARGSSPWNLGRLLNILLQLLQVALVLGATVLEPTNHLKQNKD